jgi:hypothetical protein
VQAGALDIDRQPGPDPPRGAPHQDADRASAAVHDRPQADPGRVDRERVEDSRELGHDRVERIEPGERRGELVDLLGFGGRELHLHEGTFERFDHAAARRQPAPPWERISGPGSNQRERSGMGRVIEEPGLERTGRSVGDPRVAELVDHSVRDQDPEEDALSILDGGM